MRWLYHIVPRGTAVGERVSPASLVIDGFIHCSFRDEVRESALLYFPRDIELSVLRIDPRRVDAPVELAPSPRGLMPHIRGSVPSDAVVQVLSLEEMDAAPDVVTGTVFGFVAFEKMTLLDLVGALDALGRIASMGFDPTARTVVMSADGSRVFDCEGMKIETREVRPSLADVDVLVIAGGLGARALAEDPAVIKWLASYPENRIAASVCTGALLLGAAGRLRGKRATTHPSALPMLEAYGATPIAARLVDEGQLVTGGGVACSLDVGIHLVRKLEGEETARKIAAQMCLPDAIGVAERTTPE